MGFATRRDKAGIDAGKEDKDSMDDGKVEEDAKNEDIDREGVDDAAQEAHAPYHIARFWTSKRP